MDKFIKDRLLWLAFAVAFLAISSVLGYMFQRLTTVSQNQGRIISTQENQAKIDESNKRQWQKISTTEKDLAEINAKLEYMYKDVERLKGIHIK
jgi:hypothetical protein